jgi:large repetitive protein
MRHRAPSPLQDLLAAVRRRPRRLAVAASVLLAATAVAATVSLTQDERVAAGGARETLVHPTVVPRLPAPTVTDRSATSSRSVRPSGTTGAPSDVATEGGGTGEDGTPGRSPAGSGSSTASRPAAPGGGSGGTASSGGGGSGATQSPSSTGTPTDDSSSDGDPPETTAATAGTSGDVWTVLIGANEPASFECSLDDGAFVSCLATTAFADLDNGRHTLAARAVDGAGNVDPTPAELATTVTGPNVGD